LIGSKILDLELARPPDRGHFEARQVGRVRKPPRAAEYE
jgi:hypothetical protein